MDPLTRCSWYRLLFSLVTLDIGLSSWVVFLCTLRFDFRWVVIYTFRYLPYEIHQQSSSWNIESFFSSEFSEVFHDASVYDPWFQWMIDLLVVLAMWAPWILGHISLPKFSSLTLSISSIRLWAYLFPIHFQVGFLYLFILSPESPSPELSILSRPWVL